jgi:hypothetical protein
LSGGGTSAVMVLSDSKLLKCNFIDFFMYLCIMKDEITIPEHFPESKEENIKTATKRRENYALRRDLLAEENNEAIVRRLAKEREKPE